MERRIVALLEGWAARAPEWLHRFARRVHWPLSAPRTLYVALASVGVAALLYQNCGARGCPDVRVLSAYQPGGAPQILDRDGEHFADLAPYERVVVALDSLPAHVPNAFIAVEDRRFYRHDGVDWFRVLGALRANVRAGAVTQGSSTISMQLARNVFPDALPGTQRTLRRKLQEAQVAQRIESRFSKEEILELYLNHIYFGGGAYGIEAASQLYFDKPASALTLSESAVLAALPKAPATYDPRRHPERARERRDLVLGLMRAQELAPADEIATAQAADIDVSRAAARDRSSVPSGAFFIDVVRDLLDDEFGSRLYRSRLRIYTTLDAATQRAAERELKAQIERLDGQVRAGDGPLQGAMVVMDARTGDVRALVGGRDAATTRYNRAIHARRQVGSAFKPFVYAAALSEGYPASQLIADEPLRMELSGNDVWEPKNYDGRYEGDVSMREALVRSRNVPTVRLASAVGIHDVAVTARSAGVYATMDETPALALGTVAMSPLQLATAYTTFATLGTTAEPRFVLRVEDEDGNVLWQRDPVLHPQALDPGVAYIVNDILRDAVDRGTGTGVRSAGFRGVVAGKTGTTNNATDAWFVGFTTDAVGAVWLGYDTPSSIGSAATGGGLAAPVWGRVMGALYDDAGPEAWTAPASIVQLRTDPETGLVLDEGCEPRYTNATQELYLTAFVPASSCPYRGNIFQDLWDRIFGGDRDRDRDRDRGRDRDRWEDARERRAEQMERARERQQRELERRQREIEEYLERQARRRGGH